jgi:hypothetical protein
MSVGPFCWNSCENCELQNRSLSFNGVDDYVELSQITDIGSVSSTVSMWVKIPVVGQGNLNEGERVGNLLGNYNSSPNSNWEVTQGQTRIWWNNGEKDIYGSFDLRDNQWHHLAFVRDKENNQLLGYIDGEIDLISDGVGSDISFNTPFLIGKDYRAGTGIPFHGSVDNLSIWDVAKNQEEIQENMYNNLSGYEDGLVGYWDFNDGEGSTLTDLSGNENDGTIYGATWSDDIMQPPYNGPEWFVSIDGSDDNNGSEEYPFGSIQHAVDAANDYDMVQVLSGEYFENIIINKNIHIGGNNEDGDITINGDRNGKVSLT